MRRIVDTSDPVNWSHPLNRGLVSWWLALPDQQRGVIWRDLCRRNHGTLTSGPTWQGASGRQGGWGSLALDGSDDLVNAGTASGLDFERTDKFSICAWIFVDTTTPLASSVITRSDTSSFSKGWAFVLFRRATLNSTSLCFTLISSTIGNNMIEVNAGASAISSGRWTHVACSYNGSSLASGVKLYIDGALKTNTVVYDALSASSKATGVSVSIGGRYLPTPSQYLDGKIDDVRVWNREVSESEIVFYYVLSRQRYPGVLNRLPDRRSSVVEASPGGLAIPIAAYHYNHHLGSMG